MNAAEDFRAALGALTLDPAGFLASGEGAAFVQTVRRELAPQALRHAHSLGSGFSDLDEAVNMIILNLVDSPETCRYVGENAVKPFAYIGTVIPSWLVAETGRGLFRTTGDEYRWAYMEWIEAPGLQLPAAYVMDPADIVAGDDRPTLMQAVQRTVSSLAPRTVGDVTGVLSDLVGWFAENPFEQQSTARPALDAAAAEFSMVSAGAISAVANISWGGRPNRGETSLLGGHLRSHDFNPLGSAAHLKALRVYRSRMRDLAAA